MSERVRVIEGSAPILIIAPHGFDGDDENTKIVAAKVAEYCNAYAVVNQGWERAEDVDFLNDKADCNNVLHCMEDVVREEFLDPILRYKSRILKNFQNCNIYMIHGMANRHRLICGDDTMDVVVGFGSKPSTLSCELWRKDAIIETFHKCGINAYEGKKGGQFSGSTRKNMNQLFKKWHFDDRVNSLQIEIIFENRKDKNTAELFAKKVGEVIIQSNKIKEFYKSLNIKQY